MTEDCFLCSPDKRLVFAESKHFYAMLGLGPIMEGYSILASRAHTPSYFDLPRDLTNDYLDFRAGVLDMLAKPRKLGNRLRTKKAIIDQPGSSCVRCRAIEKDPPSTALMIFRPPRPSVKSAGCVLQG